jgi:TPP-dependent 2-oxoacid decarboxylase
MNTINPRKIEDIMPKVEMVTVGTYLARRLMQVGVGHYFTVPGDFTLSLLDEFLKEDQLNMIGCCNELNAAYAADGYARATGGMGVVCTTYMVGGLSAINGIAGAYSDDLPVLMVSGGPNYLDANERHLIHHTIGEYDLYQQSRCYEPVVAKTYVIRHLNDCSSMIDSAITTALNKKKPVYLEIPVNLSTALIPAPVDWSVGDASSLGCGSDSLTLTTACTTILQAITNSTKPIILVGNKLRTTGTDGLQELTTLIEKLNSAVAIMPDAKGLFNEEHPNYIGRYWGTVSTPHVAEVVESSDLIIAVGPVWNDYTTVGWSTLLSPNKLIVLGPDYCIIGGRRFHNVKLLDILRELAQNCTVTKNNSLLTYQRYALPDGHSGSGDGTNPNTTDTSSALTLRNVKDIVQASLTCNTTVITETGDSWFIGQSLRLPEGCQYMVQMQYGSIGWSVGALLGAAMVEGRRVLALIGDGSFQVTAQELSTMIRYGVKATILVLNNKGYTIEVQIHDGAYNDTKNWDYAGLVNTFNAEDGRGLGLRASTADELTDALSQADAHDGVCLIECTLDRDDCTQELLEWGSRVCKANGRR